MSSGDTYSSSSYAKSRAILTQACVVTRYSMNEHLLGTAWTCAGYSSVYLWLFFLPLCSPGVIGMFYYLRNGLHSQV